MQKLKQLFNEIKSHNYYTTLMSHAKSLSYRDALYSKKLVSKRDINHLNHGDGYETDVTSATYEDNFNYDLQITKKYYKQIINKKYSYDLYYMLVDDLEYYSYSNVSNIFSVKYLYSDIKLLSSFSLVETIGNYYLLSNPHNNDIITINFENVLHSKIYNYLFFHKITTPPYYVELLILLFTFLYSFFMLILYFSFFYDTS